MKRIPKSFTLFGMPFTVEILDKDSILNEYKHAKLSEDPGLDLSETRTVYGLADIKSNTIYVLEQTYDVCPHAQLSWFHHELCHILLFYAGRFDLWKDEQLVDVLGNLIMQADLSAVYED